MQLSRSELYAVAFSRFLKSLDDEAFTPELTKLYAGNPAKVEQAFVIAQLKVLDDSEW
jgi:hypothetical protein